MVSVFNAGGIYSDLKLDLTGYSTGMVQATTMAEGFGPVFAASVDAPLINAQDVAAAAAAAIGGAMGQVDAAAQQTGSTVASAIDGGMESAAGSTERLRDELGRFVAAGAEAAGGAQQAGAAAGESSGGFSSLTASMLESEGLMQLFPSLVTDFMVDPLLGVVAAAKEAAESMIDIFTEVGNQSGQMSLAAEKAGLTIEQYSTLAAVGKTVGVSTESLGTAFKLLQRNTEDAVNGQMPKMAEEFQKLGISTDFLKEHLNDPGAIFAKLQEAISSLPSSAERTAASLQLLGRGGTELVPLLDLPKAKFDELAATMKNLGATETEEGGKSGRAFVELGAIASAAWEGVKKAFAEPLLDKLGGNLDAIIPKIAAFAEIVREGVTKTLDIAWPVISAVWDVLKDLGTTIGDDLIVSFQLLAPAIQIVADILTGMLEIIADVLDGFQQLASFISGGALTPAFDASNATGTGSSSDSTSSPTPNIRIDALNVEGVDTDAAASQIAAKLQPALRDAYNQQSQQLVQAGTHSKVHRAVRGHNQ